MELTQRTIIKTNFLYLLFMFLLIITILPPEAYAGGTGGGLPYESWVDDILNSLTGNTAAAISVIGFIVSMLAFIFGGDDMKGWMRGLLFLVLCCSMALGANDYIHRYSGSGAEFSVKIIK